MTDDRVISFEMNAARLAAGGQVAARLAAATRRPADARGTEKAVNRAKLASVYAGLIGADVAETDLAERITAASARAHGRTGLAEVAQGLSGLGLTIRLEKVARPEATVLPALAEMTNGQMVLVLGLFEGDVELYDPTTSDHRTRVAMEEFLRVYSGNLLRARNSMDRIERRHLDQTAEPHWFWGEFRHYRRQFTEVAAGSLFANLLAVAIALFSLQVYDRVIPYQSEPTLWVLAIGVGLAVLMEGALKVARSQVMDATGRRIELAVQDRLMNRLLGMKMGPGERKPSEVFSAMREFGSVREFFTASTIGTLADLPFLFVFLFLVASIAGNIVWILIAGAVLMVLPGFLFQRRMMALTAATQGASTRAARLLYETVFEHETVTTQRGEDRILRIWTELNALTAARASDQRRLTTILTAWSQGIQQVTYVGAVVAGAYLVFRGDFTVGTIIAVGILTGRTLGPLAQLSAVMARWSNTRSALDGLDAIANARQTEDSGRRYLRRDRLEGAYELRNVEFRYDPAGSPTVDIPAMAIPAGQHVAVLGANGSGKSTFLRLLAGLYEPGQGRVLVDGVDLGQIHPRDLRRNIGYLGQEVRLVAGTLRDNLNMSQLERDDDRLMAALDFAGLGPFVRNHPRGLDLEVREQGEGLSVGQRQSIGWARLWLQDPPVVLLDEPTAALDQTLETTLVSRLGGWLNGRTAIVATHRVPILQLTSRTLILQQGRLAVDGPKDAVLAHLAKAQGAAR